MSLYTSEEKEAIEGFLALASYEPPYKTVEQRNTVARLALGALQEQLPQVGFAGDGEMSFGRARFDGRRNQVSLMPQFLFMINWADSAPGISWPESYHATYLPEFERFVVTAALDCPDMWGVTELAIGHFPGDMPLRDGARQVIEDWWRFQNDEGNQERWAYVWSEGIVDCDEANRWADAVWPEFVDEEDDDA